VPETTAPGTTTTLTSTTTTREGRECAQLAVPPANIVFVLDSSGSMSGDDFRQEVAFVESVITEFPSVGSETGRYVVGGVLWVLGLVRLIKMCKVHGGRGAAGWFVS
jgi:hypothetical protein